MFDKGATKCQLCGKLLVVYGDVGRGSVVLEHNGERLELPQELVQDGTEPFTDWLMNIHDDAHNANCTDEGTDPGSRVIYRYPSSTTDIGEVL